LPDLSDADWLAARRDEVRQTHREILVRLASNVQQRAPRRHWSSSPGCSNPIPCTRVPFAR
jgi:hypothetical protein